MAKGMRNGASLLVLLTATLAASCGDDSGGPAAPLVTQVPESWRGVWALHLVAATCDPSIVLLDTTVTGDICPGDSLGLPFDLGDSLCTSGSVVATETSIRFSCTGPYEQGGCTGSASVGLSMSIDPTAGTMSGSGQAYIDSGNCGDLCVLLRIAGSRVPGEPSCAPAKPAGSASPLLAAFRRARPT
jgi:hypothetical protein